MVQILPARRDAVTDKILSQDISTPISQFISEMQNAKTQKQSTEKMSKFLGQDVSGFSPEIQQKLIENKLKGELIEQEYELSGQNEIAKEKAKQKSIYEEKYNMAKKLGLGVNQEQPNQMEETNPAEEFPGIGVNKPISNKPKNKPKQPTAKKQEQPPHTQQEIDAAGLYNPTLANNWQRQNEDWHRRQEHKEKTQQEEKKFKQQKLEFFHNETKKFDESLAEQATAAEKKNRALERQIKDIDKIGWWDRAVSALASNTPYGDLLKSKTAQEFDANTLPQLEGQIQILGGIL